MEFSECIYKGVVETSYRKPNRADSKCAGHSRQKKGEYASMWTLPKKGESADKCIKRHLDILFGKSKCVSSTTPDILRKNVRSWETSELSTLIVVQLRNAEADLYPGMFLMGSR